MNPSLKYEYYQAIFKDEPLPLAFVDLDLFDENAKALSQRAGPIPMRLATKSVRCLELIQHTLRQHPSFRGLMAYSADEAAFLAQEGLDDILIGYPSTEIRGLKSCLLQIKSGKQIIFMIDAFEQARLLAELANELKVEDVPICLDLDLSTHFPFLHFGIYRSPLRCYEDIESLLHAIEPFKNLNVVGLMGYEGQLAGVADDLPRSPLYNFFVRFLKTISKKESFARREETVRKLKEYGIRLKWVNGGGTGSIEATREDSSVTELTIGSGLYSPALFDNYRDFKHLPAAGFALPIVRQARHLIYACSGGGYIASGPVHRDKQPSPYLPQGLQLFPTLGAGEVQTSIRASHPLKLGNPVFFRHAKAGELCERFNSIYLIRTGKIEKIVKTYRGQGLCFF